MTHKESLKLILWNATSVKNKIILELQNFLNDYNMDIVIVSETWLASTDTPTDSKTLTSSEKTDPFLPPVNQE